MVSMVLMALKVQSDENVNAQKKHQESSDSANMLIIQGLKEKV